MSLYVASALSPNIQSDVPLSPAYRFMGNPDPVWSEKPSATPPSKPALIYTTTNHRPGLWGQMFEGLPDNYDDATVRAVTGGTTTGTIEVHGNDGSIHLDDGKGNTANIDSTGLAH